MLYRVTFLMKNYKSLANKRFFIKDLTTETIDKLHNEKVIFYLFNVYFFMENVNECHRTLFKDYK